VTGRESKAWRPCCGQCRMTALSKPEPDTDIVCQACGAPWDGSEVSPDKLPALMEQAIADGELTREQAFAAFLELDELADATVAGDITPEQGMELVERSALRTRGKGRAQ
jgi:hypothetical protein